MSNQELFSQRGAGLVGSFANRGQHGGMSETDVADTLHANGGDTGNGSENIITMAVRGRGDHRNLELRDDGTANAILTPNGGRDGMGVGCVAISTAYRTSGNCGAWETGDRTDAITTGTDPCSHIVASTVSSKWSKGTGGYAGQNETENCVTVPAQDPAFCLGACPGAYASHGDGQTNYAISGQITAFLKRMRVRRLTVTECERLQGFPDGYTKISWKGKDSESCPDGPRYKALGNSMAVPVMGVDWATNSSGPQG